MSQPNLPLSLHFLESIIRARLAKDLQKKDLKSLLSSEPKIPQFASNETTSFTQFIINKQLTGDELVIVMLALVPHIYPHFLDSLVMEYLPKGGEYPSFGGVKGINHRGTLPTGETALYILAGNNLEKRFALQQLFSQEHFFAKENILYLETVSRGEPPMSGRLVLDEDYVELFTTGKQSIPKLSTNFPAQHLITKLDWDALVLNPKTLNQIKDLECWIKYNHILMNGWGMSAKLKPGYRALFYGPPGTGKTLTATLLGKYTGKEVFRIDLSMVVSKYIGETEKNLSTLFDKAANKNWILFFDEADALFGKRTGVRDAHDRYANQEVSYLLQRIEMFEGLSILASNFKDNIDEAFVRRFNSIIYFPKPKPEERLLLWQKAFPSKVTLEKDIDLEKVARDYELTGSHIINIVQYACLSALDQQINVLNNELLKKCIQVELAKEGKGV